jgi:hypothetical protein
LISPTLCYAAMRLRSAARQRLRETLVSSIAQFSPPNVLEWPVASSTYNIRTHQEQYYSAKALSWCSTAELVFNDPPLMLQCLSDPIGRPLAELWRDATGSVLAQLPAAGRGAVGWRIVSRGSKRPAGLPNELAG